MQLGIGIGPSFGQKTMLQRAINTLRKYGTAAHYWDFGISQEKLAYGATHTAAEFLARYPLHHLFQDSAGTLPLYAIGQPCGLVKDPFGGAHASQSTTTKRPILGARYNYLLNTEFAGVTYGTWGSGAVAPTGWSAVASTGDISLYQGGLGFSASGTRPVIAQTIATTLAAGCVYRVRSIIKSITATSNINIGNLLAIGYGTAAGTQTWVRNGLSALGTEIPAIGDVIEVLYSCTASGSIVLRYGIGCTGGATGSVSLSYPDLRPANSPQNIPAYQRVTSATDYDTAGFPARLVWDGVDDCLVVPVLDLSGTDKVTVIAGVTKLSDVISGSVFCTGSNQNILYAPSYTNGPVFTYRSFGTAGVNPYVSGFPAPVSAVVSASSSISTPFAKISANRITDGTSNVVTSQGTGNYSSSALYIGTNAIGTFPFNGSLQSLTVIGNLLPDGEVKLLEDLTNKAMGKVY